MNDLFNTIAVILLSLNLVAMLLILAAHIFLYLEDRKRWRKRR